MRLQFYPRTIQYGGHRRPRLTGFCALLAVALVFNAATQAGADETKTADSDAKAEKSARDPIVPTAEQIETWIAELSHDAFTIRQAAATRLLTAGVAAREPLRAAAESPDPETRAAARRLVALINQSEFQRRLDAFAADVDGRRGLSLPGWERFRELIGADAGARALFVEMQRHEAPLLSAMFGGGGQPAEPLWEERLTRLISWNPTLTGRSSSPPLGSCAAMLFLGSIDEMDVSDRGALMLETLVQRTPIREAIQPGTADEITRRLVGEWILHCPNKNEMIVVRRLALASAFDLKEALPLALAVAGGDPQYLRAQPFARAHAALIVGQFGAAEHAEQLEPLLEDTTVCQQLPGEPVRTVQVRDVALVVMLHLTGQSPADYGYLNARIQPQRLFQLQTLHLDNDEQRAKAIAKWRAWRAENKAEKPRE